MAIFVSRSTKLAKKSAVRREVTCLSPLALQKRFTCSDHADVGSRGTGRDACRHANREDVLHRHAPFRVAFSKLRYVAHAN